MNKQLKLFFVFLMIVTGLLYFGVKQDKADSEKRKSDFNEQIDKDISNLEEEYINKIMALAKLSSETEKQIDLYKRSNDSKERQSIFSKITSLSAADTASLDQNNQLIRGQMDTLAGIINRRDILMGKKR